VTGRAIRRYQMLVRVSTFGAEHAAAFPIDTVAARTFVEVQETASQLEQHAVTQASVRSRDRVYLKAAARKRLRESLRDIGRTARALAIDAPGIQHMFRVPRTNRDHALLTAARVFMAEAGERAVDFIAFEHPPTFLGDLGAAIGAFEHAAESYHGIRQAGRAATAGVDMLLARGLAAVRRLDVIAANVFHADVLMMAAWRQTRRV
jgi:hypothetical protein